jgi:hypothetical protein
VAPKERLVGVTESTGCVLVSPVAYADAGPSAYDAPVVHDEGRVVSVDWELVSDGDPQPQYLSRNFSVPPGARSAIQYIVPEVTAVGAIATVFQAPFAGAPAVDACASSVPGCEPLLA